MTSLIRMLSTLMLVSGTGVAMPLQYAEIKEATLLGKSVTLTVNYVDVFFTEAEYAAKVVKLGYYKSAEDFYDSNPSGIYIRDTNARLRVMKTDSSTIYNLVCIKSDGGLKKVSAGEFISAFKGKGSSACKWDFGGLVFMKLEGGRILEISQLYTP